MANTQNLDLVKPLGTDYALVSVLNSNSDKIDAYAGAVNASLDGLRDGLGILANGNTHAAITSGQYVYVKNHQTLPEGLYKATANIAANGTLSTSNLAADSAGGLNSLNEQIGNLNNKTTFSGDIVSNAHSNVTIHSSYRYIFKSGNIACAFFQITLSDTVQAWNTLFKITPEEAKPFAQQHVGSADGSHLYISTDGSIGTAGNMSAGVHTISFTYVTK